jgi:hypothetical protein
MASPAPSAVFSPCSCARRPRVVRVRHPYAAILAPVGSKLTKASAGRYNSHTTRSFRRHMKNFGEHVADCVRSLTRQGHREAVVFVFIFRDDTTRVEIVGNDPLIDERQRDDFRRPGEGAGGCHRVAERDIADDIAATPRPGERRAEFERRDGTDHVRSAAKKIGDFALSLRWFVA